MATLTKSQQPSSKAGIVTPQFVVQKEARTVSRQISVEHGGQTRKKIYVAEFLLVTRSWGKHTGSSSQQRHQNSC